MFPSRLVSVLGKGAFENNYSLDFDGTDEDIVVADDSSLDITTDITISCWVKVSSFDSDYDGLVGKDDIGGVGYALWLDKGGSTSVGTANFAPRVYNGQLATSGSLNINTWYHIVGTHESGSVDENKIYINGVLADTTADTYSMAANNDPLHIGSQFGGNSGYNLNGSLDGVAIWNTTLSANAITAIYNNGKPTDLRSNSGNYTSASSLVGYWRCGDGDTYPTITDNSTNSNDGTMTNMAAEDIVEDTP